MTAARLRFDAAAGEWRLIARYRAGHRCRSCKSYLSASQFGRSRILKRDYECRWCHARRCSRERLMGIRGRTATAQRRGTIQPQEVRP